MAFGVCRTALCRLTTAQRMCTVVRPLGLETRAVGTTGGRLLQRSVVVTKEASTQAVAAASMPTAAEVCENIMRHVPKPDQSQALKNKQRKIFTVLVQNEPGVLSKISGMISARGFNIDSLVVGRTDVPDLSRMTLVFFDTQDASEQLRAQLEDLVPVWAVFDYTDAHVVERELILIKVSLDKENSDLPLRMRRDLNRRSLTELTTLFFGKVQDVGVDCVILELVLKPSRVVTFLSLLRPYNILEVARTGIVAMSRPPVEYEFQEETQKEIDISTLPPS